MKLPRLVSIVLTALILLATVAAAPIPAQAASGDERITRYDIAAELNSIGQLQVVETISYDLGTTSHHGIYRAIPTRYLDDSDQHYRLSVHLMSVEQDGQPAKYERLSSSGLATLKIGDPDRALIGVHVYRITYQLVPIVTTTGAADQFKFNLTGNGWEVPIEEVHATVSLPQAPTAAPSCFTGYAGSKESACLATSDGRTVVVDSTSRLATGQGMSLFIDLPPNSVTQHLQPFTPAKPWPILLWAPAMLALIALGAVGRLFWGGIGQHFRRTNAIIVPQYDAPGGLTPAEVGLLKDNRAGMMEITATLIDVAVRGHLKITQTRAKAFLRKAEYQFDRLQGKDELRPYERELLDAMFGGKTTVKLSDVAPVRTSQAITKITNDLGKDLVSRGLYTRTPGAWRAVTPAILGIAAFLPAALSWSMLQPDFDGWNPVGFIIASLGSLSLSGLAWYLASRPSHRTPDGQKLWEEVEGLKLFLTVAEKDRLNFSDAPERTPQLFNKLLPWAVALGVEEKWAKQFNKLNVAEASSWYVGPVGYHFTASSLASSLSHDFSSGMAAVSPSSVSSGSSSGGGFSGGGFGGGGGGSW